MVLVILFFALILLANLFPSSTSSLRDDVDWRDEYFRQGHHLPRDNYYGQPMLPPYGFAPHTDPRIWYEYENRRQNQMIRLLVIVLIVIVIAFLIGKYFR